MAGSPLPSATGWLLGSIAATSDSWKQRAPGGGPGARKVQVNSSRPGKSAGHLMNNISR
jgi:hypothetical protein